MPLIKSKYKPEKEQVRLMIDNQILGKIKQYCEWANVKKHDDFFEQAAEFVLSKDKDWQAYISQKSAD